MKNLIDNSTDVLRKALEERISLDRENEYKKGEADRQNI